MSVKRLIALICVFLLVGCTDANQSAPQGSQAARAELCTYPSSGEPAKLVDPPSAQDVLNTGEVQAVLHFTAGDVTITMDRSAAPCTVHSFLSLAQQGWLDNSACHRLTDYGIFVLQCGDPSGSGYGGPGYTIPDELSPLTTGLEPVSDKAVNYPKGTVAMANVGKPNTGGPQFFIVWEDSPLAPEYAVFGRIDDAGLEVIRGIAAQGVDAEDGMTPIAEAKITSVTLG